MKAVEAASATIIANGYGETFSSCARASATGANQNCGCGIGNEHSEQCGNDKKGCKDETNVGARGEVSQTICGQFDPARPLQSDGKGQHADDQHDCFPVDRTVGAREIDAAEC